MISKLSESIFTLTPPIWRSCTASSPDTCSGSLCSSSTVNFCRPNAIRLELDAGVEATVGNAAGGDSERAPLDIDESSEVRILSGAGDAHVRLERTGDVRHLVREALNHAEIERRGRDLQIDLIASRLGYVAGFRAALEERGRDAAFCRDELRRRLLQLGVDTHSRGRRSRRRPPAIRTCRS